MNSYGEEEAQTTFEICVVVSRRNVKEEDETCDCVEFLVKELRNVGFIVERVHG
jgi:anoctamin-10